MYFSNLLFLCRNSFLTLTESAVKRKQKNNVLWWIVRLALHVHKHIYICLHYLKKKKTFTHKANKLSSFSSKTTLNCYLLNFSSATVMPYFGLCSWLSSGLVTLSICAKTFFALSTSKKKIHSNHHYNKTRHSNQHLWPISSFPSR